MNTLKFHSKHGIGVALAIAAALGCSTQTTVVDPPPAQPDQPLAIFNGAAFQAATPPAPISGGTLLAVTQQDGTSIAFAADPDEDVVNVVALGQSPHLVNTVQLQPGDQPGRIVADGAGRVHVVLRQGGAIATLVVGQNGASLLMRRAVCNSPRGIDYDATNDSLWVVCATGELMSLPASGGDATIVQANLARDLRDVVVDGNKLYVTRFREAQILTLDKTGAQMSNPSLPPMPSTIMSAASPDVAWRTAKLQNGGVRVLFQVASNTPIDVATPPGVSSYGGGPTNSTIVQGGAGGVVTVAVADFTGPNSHAVSLVSNPVVDMATSPDGVFETVSITGVVEDSAGALDPRIGVFSVDDGQSSGTPDEFIAIADARVSQTQTHMVVLQRRGANAGLVVLAAPIGAPLAGTASLVGTVAFPAPKQSHVDTGFDVFHMPTTAGIACMNCHPEGGDDSHTWTFALASGDRVRRTQSLRGGVVTPSAPYHWDGDMADLQTLCDEVFTHRMGGAAIAQNQTPTLAHFLNGMPRVPVRAGLDPTKVAAGKALFEGAAACGTCHVNGAGTLADNQDIGKTDSLGAKPSLQVPMLVGVADRAPYMHDGCAATLADRFNDTGCAGSKHGNTANLSADDKANLVEYLESL